MKAAQGKLLVRLAPFHGESLRSYIHRLSQVNGFPLGVRFGAAVGGEAVEYTNEEFPLERLASLVDRDRSELEKAITFRGVREYRNRRFEYAGFTSRVVNGHFGPERYCPACLDEAPFLRAEWSVPLWACCTRHRVILEASCPTCQKRIRTCRPDLAACHCGTPLDAHAARVAATPALLAQQAMCDYAVLTARLCPSESLALLKSDRWYAMGHEIHEVARNMLGRHPMWAADTATTHGHLECLWLATGADAEVWRHRLPDREFVA